MRAAGHTKTMWCCLVLGAQTYATDCPPVPATAMAGQRSTANATALAAREVAATLRRDAPAPGAAADVLRAVLRSRDDFLLVLRNRVFVDRAFLTKSKHAAHAAFVASVAKRVRLGNVAYRAGQKLEWDAKNMKFPNAPEAEKFLKRDYRKGWTL